MNILQYLGTSIEDFLELKPFKNWKVERSTEDYLEEQRIYYEFTEQYITLQCNPKEIINVIFLDEGFNHLSSFLPKASFSMSQNEIRENLGTPNKSGGKNIHPILGEYGNWDLFSQKDYSIHFEYHYSSDKLKLVTIMQNDQVPQ